MFRDEWIEEHYPNAEWFIDKSGEVGVMLGIDSEGKPVC